tara:strand:+ start:234 stop:749 length:516 start_codon:yes stop_codon:yes gene_type:complete
MRTRRIVTGIDSEGRSFFQEDGETPGYLDLGAFVDEEIWIDDPGAAETEYVDPASAEKFDLVPPQGGSRARIFTFMPDKGQSYDPEVISKAAQRFNTGEAMDPENPGMHTTATIDYGIVLSGNITLELEEGSRKLGPGDIVVQRATAHAWRNYSDQPCTMLFVLISSPKYM